MWVIYTDGSCLQNPGGPGGWAYCANNNAAEKLLYCDAGGVKVTTNNRMELQAVIEGLRFVQDTEDKICEVYTDSRLTLNCAIGVWKRNSNEDLWDEYNKVSKGLRVKYHWVAGHSGVKLNELVDKMANHEAIQIGYSEPKPKKIKKEEPKRTLVQTQISPPNMTPFKERPFKSLL